VTEFFCYWYEQLKHKIDEHLANRRICAERRRECCLPPGYGTGVAVRVAVRVILCVAVRVAVFVLVAVLVRVLVRVTVLVWVAVFVRVTVFVGVADLVRVAVLVGVKVLVRVAVLLGVKVLVRVAVLLGVKVLVGVGVGVATNHLAYRITFPAVLGRYGNVNVLPPTLADHPTKVSLDRVGGVGADIGCPCNTTPVAIPDPP
jgi:hypothetical protein